MNPESVGAIEHSSPERVTVTPALRYPNTLVEISLNIETGIIRSIVSVPLYKPETTISDLSLIKYVVYTPSYDKLKQVSSSNNTCSSFTFNPSVNDKELSPYTILLLSIKDLSLIAYY